MQILAQLQKLLAERTPVALVTVIGTRGSTPRKPGARMLVTPEGLAAGTVGGGTFEHKILQETPALIQKGGFHRLTFHLTRELAMCCGGEMEVTVEVFSPPPRLLIFGAGHIAQALCPLAQQVGFEVTVLDDREEFANPKNFPEAHTIETDTFAPKSRLPLEATDFCLVMTSEHSQDQKILEMILEGPEVFFTGLVGSQTKISKFKERFKAKGIGENRIDQIICPVGLDIGAETPEEIAVSIVAQLIERRARRS